MELSGIFLPATTPFDPFTGDADLVALRANLRRWLAAPVDGVVLFGSTGEGPLLDEDERVRLLAGARELVDGGRLLLAGTGAESTRATIRLSRQAAEAGADAVMVQPPAYYKPQMTPDALRDHYTAVADASPVPVVLYQIPSRFSGVELPPGLVGELMRHPNVVGIKDSSGDLKSVAALVDACPRECAVLAGSGAALFGSLEVGAAGGIVAVGLLMPDECAGIFHAYRAERPAEAGRLQERVAPLHRAVVADRGVPGVKAALELVGMHGGPPRSPLKPLRTRDRAAVEAALQAAGLRVAAAAG